MVTPHWEVNNQRKGEHMGLQNLGQQNRFTGFVRLALATTIALLGLACGGSNNKPVTPIRIKGPMSYTGTNASLGAQSIWGINAMVAWINTVHGGVNVGGQKRPLEYDYTDDASTNATVTTVTNTYCADAQADFLFGTYGSGGNVAAAAAANTCDKLMMEFGGAADSIFANGYANVVQILTPASKYDVGFMDIFAAQFSGIPNAAFLFGNDSFATTVAAADKAYATSKGFNVVYDNTTAPFPGPYYGETNGITDPGLLAEIPALAAVNPDVVIGGGHDADGQAIPVLLAANNASPKAVSLLVAPANADYFSIVTNLCLQQTPVCTSTNATFVAPPEGVMTPEQWDLGLPYGPDLAATNGEEYFGPTEDDFLAGFHAQAGNDQTPAYQAAMAGAAVLVLARAIEKANSTKTADVRAELGNMTLMTFFGDFGIDNTGLQTKHSMIEAQWINNHKYIVWPSSVQNHAVEYPIPARN